MINIYHLGVSQSDRVVWPMEELGLPYRLEWFDRGPDFLAPDAYVALHPAAMAPVIRDGDVLLAESTAILQYIAHRHGGGRFTVAPEAREYPDYLYWLQFNNNAQSGLFVERALATAGHDGGIIGKVARRRLEGLYRHLEQQLGRHTYLAGEQFTLADVMSGFAVITSPAMGFGPSIETMPNVKRYAALLAARPAWQKAMAIAGPKAQRPAPAAS